LSMRWSGLSTKWMDRPTRKPRFTNGDRPIVFPRIQCNILTERQCFRSILIASKNACVILRSCQIRFYNMLFASMVSFSSLFCRQIVSFSWVTNSVLENIRSLSLRLGNQRCQLLATYEI
jgi:hypothetical protein